MVEHNKVNSKLADSQLNKLNSALKNQIGVTWEWISKCLMEKFASWIIINAKMKK